MTGPTSPPPAQGARGRDLPAYVSNGVVGLRVRENPFHSGMATLAGFVGEHPERGIEALSPAPYPLGADLALNGVWMSDAPQGVTLIDQAHDFAAGELTSRLTFEAGGARVEIDVMVFCSRTHPTIVCQEVTLRADAACDLTWRTYPDAGAAPGELVRRRTETPGEDEPVCDGALLWRSRGGLAHCGYAYVTDAGDSTRTLSEDAGGLMTVHALRLAAGRSRRLRVIACLVPSALHAQPDYAAVRLVARAADFGFEALRRDNRAAWEELWRGRIRLVGAEPRWQAITDAGFYYLNASTHPSSPSSTSIFGLATWHDYHYYFGHVMWDIDAFATPPLSVLQPPAARALLDFRTRGLAAARRNAQLYARQGLQFPWEAAATSGEEATPGGGSAAWREDHVNLHVARAFALFADITGDVRFLSERAWPVLAGVCDWIVDRVTPEGDRYVFRRLGGPAETPDPVDEDALTTMASVVVLRRALEAAERLGHPTPEAWGRVAEGLFPPTNAAGAIIAHAGYRKGEPKGATPSPLMGLFPYGYETDAGTAQRTLDFYLQQWPDYVGSPMLAAFYGVWAAWAGDRALSAKLLEEGYGAYMADRFAQTLEYRRDFAPESPAAGPFFANIGAFVSGLLFGFPGLKVDSGPPEDWSRRAVVLPQGWEAIEVDRLWIRGKPYRLVARQGAERAELTAV